MREYIFVVLILGIIHCLHALPSLQASLLPVNIPLGTLEAGQYSPGLCFRYDGLDSTKTYKIQSWLLGMEVNIKINVFLIFLITGYSNWWCTSNYCQDEVTLTSGAGGSFCLAKPTAITANEPQMMWVIRIVEAVSGQIVSRFKRATFSCSHDLHLSNYHLFSHSGRIWRFPQRVVKILLPYSHLSQLR